MAEIMVKNIPNHVVFIMDGNRRWAANYLLESWNGHKKGAEVVKEMIRESVRQKIPYFSFWGSSLDNIVKRQKAEVSYLFKLFKKKFDELAKDEEIHKDRIKVSVLGRWKELFPPETKESIQKAIDATKNYGKFSLNFFLAYSGVDEMESAIKNIADDARKNPDLKITPSLVKNRLFTKDLPPVDYLIRTGGNPHLSTGFMMWDIADAQLYFSDKLWPDFNAEDFKEAIIGYGNRTRKFGA
ncbi:di-trans,poly-cis-decaprenylcistransferase [Patescibacteria group bacterium]|nr:di-trans,poly-cis-decaprenylcistransferase [Patescibacteria group bacterium]MBU3999856.1 di-trans,poly-cis-decaprenylcistransferase [Patescibacteria group bacterium]MBU4056427.1 di-trans,poly-cis-decaprenylcistransferase [Patescibacteria group bacterium]MBU4368676.1 di-trans,poly-cis-decaprenylcistransferase [Patescibacteria group bacterium]